MSDISSIASTLAATATTGAITNSVLNQVSSLEVDQVNRLFAQLGIGQNVNTYA